LVASIARYHLTDDFEFATPVSPDDAKITLLASFIQFAIKVIYRCGIVWHGLMISGNY
jgi:hypothetical protein